MRNALILMLLSATACRAQTIDVSVTVDFGKDLGQNFGTLFEAHDGNGRRVFGAGFAGAFNSYHRAERCKVQFYVRPRVKTQAYSMQRLPRFSPATGAYVYGLGAGVYAQTQGDDYKQINQLDGDQWKKVKPAHFSGQSGAQVRGAVLESRGDRIYHGDQLVLAPPDDNDRVFRPYYGQGHICFYHRIIDADGKIAGHECVAIPWNAYDGQPADWSRAIAIPLVSEREFPYGWGQLGNEVLNCSNWGALLAFDGKRWKTLVAADMKTSYQIYAMINYHDKLYMAQYPTGFLIEYDGTNVTVMKDWPPAPPGASTSVREAQTTMIYRGELLVGVWPWSELWRLDPDTGGWTFVQRMFTHPKLHAIPVHPYEKQSVAAGMVLNVMGQRLTSMTPTGGDLIVGTSSKNGATIARDKLAFLTDAQRDEYGAVYRMHMPGNLAAVMTWKDEPTTLRFVAEGGSMTIYQDGSVMGACDVDPALLSDLSAVTVQSGRGVFGPFGGESITVKTAQP